MEVWGADIGNTHLEATTRVKLCIEAGPEFEELQGHILVIHKALYGLKSSGEMVTETPWHFATTWI